MWVGLCGQEAGGDGAGSDDGGHHDGDTGGVRGAVAVSVDSGGVSIQVVAMRLVTWPV